MKALRFWPRRSVFDYPSIGNVRNRRVSDTPIYDLFGLSKTITFRFGQGFEGLDFRAPC